MQGTKKMRIPTDREIKNENRAISSIGPKWKSTQKLHIALESMNIDFLWEEREALSIQDEINLGFTIDMLQLKYKRRANDIRVLVFEFALTGKIKRLPLDF